MRNMWPMALMALMALWCWVGSGCNPSGQGGEGTDTHNKTASGLAGSSGTYISTSGPTFTSGPLPPELNLGFNEYLSGERLVDVEVTLDGQVEVTNTLGMVWFDLVPGLPYEVTMEPPNHGPVRIHGLMGSESHLDSTLIPSNDSRDLLETMFAVDLPPETGIVACILSLGTPESRTSISGIQASLDVPYEIALVQDLKDSRGLSEGDTSLVDQVSTVIFAGVPAGLATVSLTTPAGTTCELQQPTLMVDEGGFTAARYFCTQSKKGGSGS